ncbi:hypothetical protein GCM10025779_20880 [Arthrobacter cryoconiti]
MNSTKVTNSTIAGSRNSGTSAAQLAYCTGCSLAKAAPAPIITSSPTTTGHTKIRAWGRHRIRTCSPSASQLRIINAATADASQMDHIAGTHYMNRTVIPVNLQFPPQI